jgi:hypothetical protein
MKPEFEIKYIEVQWYDKDTVTKVTESMVNLSLGYNDEIECFECETTIYPNTKGLRGQLAVRFFHSKPVNPYIKLSTGEALHLSPIKDIDTGRVWWVVKASWDKNNKFWSHAGINTAGTLKLELNGQDCHVLIGSMDFTRDQLENYLSSFKDNLWELILDDSSTIQSDKTSDGIGINEKVIECINHFVSHAEKVLNTPKAELREIQTLKPRRAVRPVNRTFMELVSKTNQRFLTSRATTPTYNVAENRYVLFALERCYRIVKQIVILSGNKSKRYAHTAEKLQNQYDSFTDSVKVNRSLVVKDLEVLRERCHCEYWQNLLLEKLAAEGIYLGNQSPSYYEVYIRTQGYSTKQNSREKDGFFIETFNNGQWGKDKGKTTILSCRRYIPGLVNCLEPNADYRIIGMWNRNETANAVIYSISTMSLIETTNTRGLEGARNKFEEEKQLGKRLNTEGWERKLSPNELEEQEKEKAALLNRIDFYTKQQKLSEYVFEKVSPKQKLLFKIIKALRQLDILPSNNFPNSMTFVQNPHYQGVHNGYKNLREITNLADDELLVNLEEIDAIGLVNMPLLYERWCLLQIIKVLKESFRFVPQDNWKYKLIEAVNTNGIDVEIKFSNTDSKRYVNLTYEKTLDSGKRPDFVIDLDWYSDDDHQNNDLRTKRFVMDAKFYNESTFEKFGGLMGVADNLYNKKNYRESTNNPVFILHPSKKILPERVTSQEWGEYSFLGELPIGDSDINPEHQYGGVFLSPIDKHLYTDELQRLLGLFFQYKLEDIIAPSNGRSDDRTVSKPFCIRCGSSSLSGITKSSGFYNREGEWVSRTPRSVWMQCNDCEQFISFNHCRKTDTRLIKNGLYWTYHSARAIEPFNIKCPSCSEWGAW